MIIVANMYSIRSDGYVFSIPSAVGMTWGRLFYHYPGDIAVELYDTELKSKSYFLAKQDGSNVDVNQYALLIQYTSDGYQLPDTILKRRYMEIKGFTDRCKYREIPKTWTDATIPDANGNLVPYAFTKQYSPPTNDILLSTNYDCDIKLLVINGLVVPWTQYDSEYIRINNIRQWVMSNVTDCIAKLKYPCGFHKNPLIINHIESGDEITIIFDKEVAIDDGILLFICGIYIRPEDIIRDVYNLKKIYVPWDVISLYKFRTKLGPMVCVDYHISWPDQYYKEKLISLGFNQAYILDSIDYSSKYVRPMHLSENNYQPLMKDKNIPMVDKYRLLTCYKEVKSCPPSISCTGIKPLDWLKVSFVPRPPEK